MAPSEAFILSNFLLSPASLPTIMSLQQFTELFPKRLRSHRHVKVLYREIQEIREQDRDLVSGNIDQETKQGEKQREELRKSILKTGIEDLNDHDRREMDMDVQFFGQKSSPASSEEYHSVSSLLSEMEAACANIEHDISKTDQDAAKILSGLNSTAGELSDLRYGKMQGPAGSADEVVDQAIKGLANLEDACYRSSMSWLKQRWHLLFLWPSIHLRIAQAEKIFQFVSLVYISFPPFSSFSFSFSFLFFLPFPRFEEGRPFDRAKYQGSV